MLVMYFTNGGTIITAAWNIYLFKQPRNSKKKLRNWNEACVSILLKEKEKKVPSLHCILWEWDKGKTPKP